MDEWVSLLRPVNVIGVAILAVVFYIMWRKDANNPATAASNSVINSSVEYSANVFEVAQGAMEMAKQSNERAASAEKAILSFEHRYRALLAYNRTLTGQLVDNNITPALMPPDLLS